MCKENIGLACGVCRIFWYTVYEKCCCVKQPAPSPTFNVICVGLTNAGKTSILNSLTFSNNDTVVPTVGFAVKDVHVPGAFLNIKELGGSDNIRQYWSRYYSNIHAVIFVVDSTNTSSAADTLKQVLSDKNLRGKPCLILANKEDLSKSQDHEQIENDLNISSLTTETRIDVKKCSRSDPDKLRIIFEEFANFLLKFYNVTTSTAEDNQV